MNRDDFLSIDAIRFGLNGLQKNFRFFLALMIIVAVLYNLPSLIVTYFFKFQILDGALSLNDPEILIPQAFASIMIYLTVELGLLGIALKFRDNAAVGFRDLFRGYPLLIKYLLATIIFWLMIMLPFLLIAAVGASLKKDATESLIFTIALLICLVPAAYLFLKYQFYGYFIVDRGSGPLEALRQSGRITEGALKNLFIFWLEMNLCIAFALGMASIFIAIVISSLLQPILELFVTGAGDIASTAINLLAAVPATKLATADIYRRREWRSARRTVPDLPGLQPAGEAGASEGV